MEATITGAGGEVDEPLQRKRVLFVDDEPAILTGLQNLLYKQRKRWEMVFVAGGELALAELRARPFDVVVSDMRMPGMDGATLLNQVREESPATSRIMLTGHADPEAIARALPALHQLLSKPCTGAALRAAIERGTADTAPRDARIRAAIGRVDRLPTPPGVYVELTELIRSPSACAAEVARIVGRAPGIAAKILQLVGAACFGGQRTASISQAVAQLGVERLRYLSLSASVFGTVEGEREPIPELSSEELQVGPARVADLAQALISAGAGAAAVGGAAASAASARTGAASAGAASAGAGAASAGAPPVSVGDAVFAAALLHDLGQIVLAQGLTGEYRRVLEEARRRGAPLSEVEAELLGATHGDVGACLLGLWGLPEPVVEIVRYHHAPERAPAPLGEAAAAVCFAEAVLAGRAGGAHTAVDAERALAAVEAAGHGASIPAWQAIAERRP